MLKDLFTNLRFYVLLLSVALAIGICLFIKSTIPLEIAQATQLDQIYGLISVAFLYFTLLATPLTRTFNNLPFRGEYIFIRRALGVSAFFFALLHVYFSFFQELGGFGGLGFLDDKYLLGISLGLVALIILLLLFLTATDWAIEKLTFPKWKLLHRFIYLLSLLTLIHVLILGSHFIDLSGVIPQIFFGGLVILLSLEAVRLDNFLQTRFTLLPKFGLSFILILVVVVGAGVFLYGPASSGGSSPFNIHAAHIQLAKQAQLGLLSNPALSNNPALSSNPAFIGDPTRRFTVSFSHPDKVLPNQDTPLGFQVFDASSGNQIELFSFVYSKTMHLVIVDNELNYFTHIHPTQVGSNFGITTQFPHPGRYHLYINFQPLGAIEQQFAFTLDVGQVDQPAQATQSPDTNLTKTFNQYQVTMTPSAPLKASEMSIGNQTIKFSIKDAKTGAPITNLKPYLAAFGHLVMINEGSYDYIHVHPSNIVAPAPDANGGPDVEFLPLGLYGPLKSGIYRVFAQFNPNNELFTADFTVQVQ